MQMLWKWPKVINFCLEVNIFANITGLVEPSKRISSSGIVVDKKVIKDRVNIDLDSGDDLGEKYRIIEMIHMV